METLVPILQIGGSVVAITMFIVLIKADIRVIGVQIDGINKRLDGQVESFRQLGDLLQQVAVQDNRIKGIEDDIREIRHGKGFVTSISGEYNRTGKVEN